MRRLALLLTTMAIALLITTGVALAATTYTFKGTSGDDNIRLVVSNRLSGDVVNVYCYEGYDTVRVTVDSGDTVNFDSSCESTAVTYGFWLWRWF
jgi:FlaG/FlaF family flagellin (archaellin)